MIQFSIRFPTTQETAYRQARFLEYRQFSIAVGIAAMVLVLALWLRDYANDPVGARHTFHLRLLMDVGVALYVAALWLKAARWAMLASGYVAILSIEFGVLAVWGNLVGGYAGGFPGYMYTYLIAPLVLLPFSFRESATLLLLVAVVPNLQVALGMAPGFPTLAFNALIWPACAIAVYAQSQFDQLFRRLFLSQVRLNELATLDSLTGLLNRRAYMEAAAQACKVAARYRHDLCVLMIDIDHFKAVNDRFGHAAGDEVLRFLTATLTRQFRSADLCARIGGEEFSAVLVQTGLPEGMLVAERLRRAVERSIIAIDHTQGSIRITVSIGVAHLGGSDASIEQMLQQADKFLYEAKDTGRNRVVGPGDKTRPVLRQVEFGKLRHG